MKLALVIIIFCSGCTQLTPSYPDPFIEALSVGDDFLQSSEVQKTTKTKATK